MTTMVTLETANRMARERGKDYAFMCRMFLAISTGALVTLAGFIAKS